MSIYCRLCAGLKTEHEIASEICDLRLMLTKCCQWQKSENESQLPQQVCFICMELLDNCWEFLVQIDDAEKKLNAMLAERKTEIKEDIAFIGLEPLIEDIKEDIQEIEDDESSSNDVPADCSLAAEQNENIDDVNDDVNDDDNENDNNDNNDDNDNNNSSNDSEHEPIGTRSRPRRKPFKSILNDEDYLASGLISTKGVDKLMAKYSDMKTLNWNNCKYKCIKCDDRMIEGINNYISHCKSVHFDQFKKMKFFCYYCQNEKFRNIRLLNSHIADAHYIHLKYQCLYCIDVYWDVNELKRHRRMHVVEAFYCEPCNNKGPMKKSNFMSHLTSKHKKKDEIKSFTCDICKNDFATISSVKLHILNKHAKIRNEICDQCGWCFAQKGNLLAHIRSVHSNIRPFQCIFCQKLFKTKTHLKNHMRIHSSTKAFACSHCSKSFITRSQLTAHNKTHALVGEFTCSYCGKNLKQRTTWQTHERIHTGDLRYVCPSPNCPYKSNCWGNLNKHTTKQHGIDLRSERWKNGPYIADSN